MAAVLNCCRNLKRAAATFHYTWSTSSGHFRGSVFAKDEATYCIPPCIRRASTYPTPESLSQKMDFKAPAKERFSALCQSANLAPKISFIGGGNMAQALTKGFLTSGLLEKDSIAACDPVPSICDYLQKEFGISAYSNNQKLLEKASGGIVILAVKPQYLDGVLEEVAAYWRATSSKFGLLASIVAGATIEKIYSKFVEQSPDPSASLPIVRIMPNTPALIGCGASVYSRNNDCMLEQASVIKALMDTVGICYEVPENHIDIVTGLSGAGPAYIYTIIDALADGGVKMGLPRDLATELSAQTVLGAAKMVLETRKHPGELKNQVCSPGGATIAGVHVLEEAGVRGAFMSAVESATKRAKELN